MIDESIGQTFCAEDRNSFKMKNKIINKKNKKDYFVWSNYGFSRDLSRIVFSNSYRRLSGKTQIFPPYENEHLINRLTHTLMVNNIAMDIASRINKIDKHNYCVNLDLVQAISNGHDIGHTPFGHAGERKLNSLSKKENGFTNDYFFKHNIFSVDVLQNLDRVKGFNEGYDLSWQVIDGILKHTEIGSADKNIDELNYLINHNFFSSPELNQCLYQISEQYINYYKYPYPLTIEGQIVKVSDELAQYYHDILDLSRFFGQQQVSENFIENIFTLETFEEDYVMKFIRSFSDGQNIKMKKFQDPNNREFFCNELKELFINDIINTFINWIELQNQKIILGKNEKRFIVRNCFFKKENNKVELIFHSKYVNKVAEFLRQYRKEMISTLEIRELDNRGANIIGEGYKKIRSDKELFCKYCIRDIVYNTKKIGEKFKLGCENLIEKDDKKITLKNMEELQNQYIDLLFLFINGDEKIIVNPKISDYLKNLCHGVIIESIAKMTDHFIEKKL